MIGSHNSFTYLRPTNPIFNLFKRYWKCQDLNIIEQRDLGVKCFDVRIFKNKEGKWQVCHGIVNFPLKFATIKDLEYFIHTLCPKACYRIAIEKKVSNKILDLILEEIKDVDTKYLWNISYKTAYGWHTLTSGNSSIKEVDSWVSPNIEINGATYWNKDKNVFQNLYNLLFKFNIKKEIIDKTKGEIYLTKGNINNKEYVILSDYVNLLK